MSKRTISWLAVVLLVFTIALVACQPQTVEVTRVVTQTETVTEEVEVPVEVEVEVTRVVTETETVTETIVEEVEKAPLGSEERPINVLFLPSVDSTVIVSGGEVMAAALEEATGYKYAVSVPTSYAATVEEMCASPDDTIGFISANVYVMANERCGVTVGGAAVRYGLSWYASQIVVREDSGIESVEDLDGLTWSIPDFGSTSGYLYPLSMLTDMGVEPGEIIEAGDHGPAMLAVYDGTADFGTAFFSPPLLPNFERQWTYGVDDPEIWREAGESPVRNEEGRTVVAGGPDEGGYRVLDARTLINEAVPDIFDQTRILALTPQIPNDTISFGPDFPLAMAGEIVAALKEFTQTEECQESICSGDFYDWTDVDQVTDSFFDPVRSNLAALGITEEDILGE
jgi:phosphonate transport system substrate-binding protein